MSETVQHEHDWQPYTDTARFEICGTPGCGMERERLRCTCGVAFGWTDSPEPDIDPDCALHGAHTWSTEPVGSDEEAPY